MTRFKLHQDVAVVEHDDATRKPREGGQVIYGSVTEAGDLLAHVHLEDNRTETFWTPTGWRAWTSNGGWHVDRRGPRQFQASDGDYCWRLVPVCERCEDPILGEPVIHPAGPGPGHIYCGSDCEDAAAEAWHELHYREA